MFGRSKPAKEGSGRTTLKVKKLDVGMWPEGLANGKALAAFQQQHPNIGVEPWSRFRVPGDFDVASELMSFAAKSAPDVTFTYVHRLQFLVDQGFLKRLNEFIGEDENGDGVLDPEEIRWKPWLDIPPLSRQMGMRGSDIYALPMGNWFSVMVYRPDILLAAGLAPHDFPKDFASFLYAGQKICALSLKNRETRGNSNGRRIYAMPRELDALFFSFLWSAGGTPGVGDLVRSSDGVTLGSVLPEDQVAERIRELGVKPGEVTVKWRTVFDGEPTRRALEAIWKLCWQPWIVDPHTGEPLNLSEAEVKGASIRSPGTGKLIDLTTVPGGIQRGICQPSQNLSGDRDNIDKLMSGELAFMMLQNNNAAAFGRSSGFYDFAPPPALDPGSEPGLGCIPMLFGLNNDLNGEKLKAGWDFLAFQCGPDWARICTDYLVQHRHLDVASPVDVERFGHVDALAKMSPNWVNLSRLATRNPRVIPYFSGFHQAQTEFFARTVRKISESPEIDIPAAMNFVQRDIEQRILRAPGTGKGWLEKGVASLVIVGSVIAMGWGIRAAIGVPKGSLNPSIGRQRATGLKLGFWLLVLPALLSVLLWSYYPAVRGLLLAFQDYRLSGEVKWVGLANFVEGVWSPRFWYTLWNSFKFIGMTVALGFFAPIALAVLLHEIPRGKYLFRTLFFLPAVTSGLVIMLLWVTLYEPTPDGVLNQILDPLIGLWNSIAPAVLRVEWPIRWLQDPRLAMLCVIIPGIWAAMGTGCLIYLAALQSVSPDLYEASEIDGAGFWRKLWNVTLPYLKPLLMINLVGALIGSAHGWTNIFIMTGGGPDLSTQVAALEIWMNSFVFLRFGMATAQAWMLGAMLIGFVVWQIKLMRSVDFRKGGDK